jgi:hypothetical protein
MEDQLLANKSLLMIFKFFNFSYGRPLIDPGVKNLPTPLNVSEQFHALVALPLLKAL